MRSSAVDAVVWVTLHHLSSAKLLNIEPNIKLGNIGSWNLIIISTQ